MEVVSGNLLDFSDSQWSSIYKRDGHVKGSNPEELKILGTLSDQGCRDYEANKKQAADTRELFEQKVSEHKLPLKILSLHYTHKRQKLVCTFTSDSRVDFREFVRELGSYLKVRIEMFHISSRESVRCCGAEFGACGLKVCCASYVPIDAGKHNDKKYSSKNLGLCGKLKCCHSFESTNLEAMVKEHIV